MIDHYRRILDDRVRVLAFERAIAAAVRPGDVVLDLGCALGNFSVFACRSGAARVYAVEAQPAIEVARRVVGDNGWGDRVRFLRGRSMDLEVPERARVVIFEDFVTSLLSPAVVRTLRDAATRWLEPGGVLLPGRARLWMAPVEDAVGYADLDRFAATGHRAYGLDVSATRPPVFARVYSRFFEAGCPVAAPLTAGEVDLKTVETAALRASSRASALRSAAVHGVALWFELDLGGEWLGTGPLSPRTAWAQVFLPLATPLVVDRGDELEVACEATPFGDDLVWQWSVAARGQRAEASNLDSLALDGAALGRWDPDHVPAPDADLELDRAILESVDGERSLEEIADRVRGRCTGRLAEPGALERRVLAVVGGTRGGAGP